MKQLSSLDYQRLPYWQGAKYCSMNNGRYLLWLVAISLAALTYYFAGGWLWEQILPRLESFDPNIKTGSVTEQIRAFIGYCIVVLFNSIAYACIFVWDSLGWTYTTVEALTNVPLLTNTFINKEGVPYTINSVATAALFAVTGAYIALAVTIFRIVKNWRGTLPKSELIAEKAQEAFNIYTRILTPLTILTLSAGLLHKTMPADIYNPVALTFLTCLLVFVPWFFIALHMKYDLGAVHAELERESKKLTTSGTEDPLLNDRIDKIKIPTYVPYMYWGVVLLGACVAFAAADKVLTYSDDWFLATIAFIFIGGIYAWVTASTVRCYPYLRKQIADFTAFRTEYLAEKQQPATNKGVMIGQS